MVFDADVIGLERLCWSDLSEDDMVETVSLMESSRSNGDELMAPFREYLA